ncbi:hypothetical protein HDR63_00120 [bacterium]|nr:hypothetical protein [bacterium]
MKPAFVLLSILALAACDQSTSTADLSCRIGDDVTVNITIKTFDEYAHVTMGDTTTVFEKVSEQEHAGQFGRVYITYRGQLESDTPIEFSILGDIANKMILQYNIALPSIDNTLYSCRPAREKYQGKSWSAAVPFHHHYKMPNKTERCIQEIVDQVWCSDENCTSLQVFQNGDTYIGTLTATEALALSPNWDYSNMKLYDNDGVIQDHEKDACDVLKRLRRFMRSRSGDNNGAA